MAGQTGMLGPPSRESVTILAFDGAGLAALLPPFQVAGLTLAVKSIFQVQHSGLPSDQMAGLTFLHRQALPPDIAPAGILMMTGSTSQACVCMGLVPEKHRAFGPGLKFITLQETYRFWFRGAQASGAQEQKYG